MQAPHGLVNGAPTRDRMGARTDESLVWAPFTTVGAKLTSHPFVPNVFPMKPSILMADDEIESD